MVTIQKQATDKGFVYEIEDFGEYVRELKRKGVETPKARYRVFISHANEILIRQSVADWESQLALFFKLGPSAGIDYEIHSAATGSPSS